MKKLLAVLGLLASFSAISYAGTPQDRDVTNGSYSNSSVYGSSVPATAGATITLSTPTVKNGVPGRYCFNYLSISGTAGHYVQLIDGNGGTYTNTNAIELFAIGTSAVNQFVTPHLEPLCLTPGNAAYLVLNGTPTVSYAGFITYGGAGGSSVNAGN